MEQYLFVIDYQNDFVDGALGFPGAEQLDEGIAEKIRSYAPGHVIFTRDTHQENYLETWEGKLLPVKHCVQGSHGWLRSAHRMFRVSLAMATWELVK